jgi:DNA-binding NarL/FixJ family response regulator
MSIRVALVDDHAVITDGLTTMLSLVDDLEVVGSTNRGSEASQLCTEVEPDVVVMDLSMPDVDGVEATRSILRDHPDIRVIALTGFLDEKHVSDVLEAGASGYLLKSTTGAELAEAIRSVANGRATLSLEALPHLHAAKEPIGPDAHLTPREHEVLELLCRGETNKQIAAGLALSPGTVRVHVSSILAKLGVENRTAAAHYAVRRGLVSNPVD